MLMCCPKCGARMPRGGTNELGQPIYKCLYDGQEVLVKVVKPENPNWLKGQKNGGRNDKSGERREENNTGIWL